MALAQSIRIVLGTDWIPTIYEQKVRQHRTRSFTLDVAEKENRSEIFYTLLGIELKVGKKRFSCPDLATARYLQIFARVGCRDLALPYDITRISSIADEMETAWQRMLIALTAEAKQAAPQALGRIRSTLIREIRNELNVSGPGDPMPEFNRSTLRRKP